MTRVIPASALDRTKHVGLLASHHGAPFPSEIKNVDRQITCVVITWETGIATSVRLTDDITIHDEETP